MLEASLTSYGKQFQEPLTLDEVTCIATDLGESLSGIDSEDTETLSTIAALSYYRSMAKIMIERSKTVTQSSKLICRTAQRKIRELKQMQTRTDPQPSELN